MRTLPSQCVAGFEDRVIGPVTPFLHSVEETAFSFCHYTKRGIHLEKKDTALQHNCIADKMKEVKPSNRVTGVSSF